jgi:hypothetical protein
MISEEEDINKNFKSDLSVFKEALHWEEISV